MQDYRRGIQALHACVAQTIAAYELNKVLHESPPEVAAAEKELPRESRAFLATALRLQCKRLNYWRKHVSVSVDNVCPECEQSPHDVHAPSLQLPGEANGPDPEGPLGPTQRGGAVAGRLIYSCGWRQCGEGYNNNNNNNNNNNSAEFSTPAFSVAP